MSYTKGEWKVVDIDIVSESGGTLCQVYDAADSQIEMAELLLHEGVGRVVIIGGLPDTKTIERRELGISDMPKRKTPVLTREDVYEFTRVPEIVMAQHFQPNESKPYDRKNMHKKSYGRRK